MPEIVEQPVDDELNLTDYNRVAVLECFLRHEARMHAAHDDWNAFRAKFIGNFVTAIE